MYLSNLALLGIKSIVLDVELISCKQASSISLLASVEMYRVTDFKKLNDLSVGLVIVSFKEVNLTSFTKSALVLLFSKVALELVVTSGVTTLKAVPMGKPLAILNVV